MRALCHTCFESNKECSLDDKGLAKCEDCVSKTAEPIIDHWGNV
jgi:hypothetical protein